MNDFDNVVSTFKFKSGQYEKSSSPIDEVSVWLLFQTISFPSKIFKCSIDAEANAKWLTSINDKCIITGTIGVVDLSRWASYGYDQRLEVFGPKGMLQVENGRPNITEHFTSEGISK